MEKLIEFIASLNFIDLYEITMVYACAKFALSFAQEFYKDWIK